MGKVALVTGGTRGIGSAICQSLKSAGYQVAANYAHDDDVANKFSTENDIPVYKWDVASFEECGDGVAKVKNNLGNIEILVNNAGIIRDAMMHKMDFATWQEVINTNLNSCFNMSKAVINDMRDNKFGRIINISSINAQAGQLGQTNYCAAKSGILGFTKALALENAKKGITVNAVAPGYIKTDMTDNVPQKIIDSLVSKIPVGRLGNPSEIARCVLFLAEDEAGFITGETLSANGGHHIG